MLSSWHKQLEKLSISFISRKISSTLAFCVFSERQDWSNFYVRATPSGYCYGLLSSLSRQGKHCDIIILYFDNVSGFALCHSTDLDAFLYLCNYRNASVWKHRPEPGH